MIIWRSGVVDTLTDSWRGVSTALVRLDQELPDGTPAVQALAYVDLLGELEPGERVLVNVSALVRGLGTGGYALVVARPDHLPPDPPPAPGHVVKARYTPTQTMVLGVDEQESPHHAMFAEADAIDIPVVVADLHSALPAVLAGIYWRRAQQGRPMPRVAYVMTDGAALPIAFSRIVAQLTAAGWLAGSVTVGQAFGGDFEATSLHTGLIAAQEVLGADYAVVSQGPGNLGTGTRWGFSGVAAGEAINAIATLGGKPVASLRVSGADARPRHRGISHHCLTAYGAVALASADVVVPRLDPADDHAGFFEHVGVQAAQLCQPVGRHRLVSVSTHEPAMLATLGAVPVRLSTMGRGLAEDPTGFIASAAAGMHAAELR